MAQIFHHSTNTIARVSIYGAVILVGILGYAATVVNQTSYITEVHNARPQIFFRRVVAIQAPTHVQGVLAPGDIHFPHGTMAGGTTNSLGYVNAVIKIHKVGERVDACP